jgi:type IV pilus assembly protein PilO
MEQLIDRLVKAPLGAKIGVVAAVVALFFVLNYFVVGMNFGASISETEDKIRRAQTEQAKLDKDYIEKTAIANNLNQFRREKELLDQRLQEALTELPNQKNLDEILQLFQDRAQKAGLEITTIEPQPAAPEGFYARIPIPMAVSGSYHEIATFLDALGRLRRIVNVSNVNMDTPKDVNGRVVVNAKFLATAFMFLDPKDAPVPAKGAKPAAKPAGSGK